MKWKWSVGEYTNTLADPAVTSTGARSNTAQFTPGTSRSGGGAGSNPGSPVISSGLGLSDGLNRDYLASQVEDSLRNSSMVQDSYSIRIDPPIADQAAGEPPLLEWDHQEMCDFAGNVLGQISVVGEAIWDGIDQKLWLLINNI